MTAIQLSVTIIIKTYRARRKINTQINETENITQKQTHPNLPN